MSVDREFGRLLQTTNLSTTQREDIMSKLLTMLLATIFAAVILLPVAFAQEKKADPVATACKGKKPGDEVTVSGKKVKCPAPKTAPAK
jgi:hypothetical protein